MIFVKAVDGPDSYLGRLLTPHLQVIFQAERQADDVGVWREWLDAKELSQVRPRRMPNGVLRATLPASLFPKPFSWAKLGSFEVRRRTFLQLWCDDSAIRRAAVLERVGAMVRAGAVRSADALGDRLASISALLEVEPPPARELLVHAQGRNDDGLTAALESLE
jgi:hypothetical protein